LFANAKKNEFFFQELEYIGHVLNEEDIKPNPKKIKAIVKWKVPQMQKGVRAFFVLANYYRKFIKKLL